tara:strand:+ start:145 stop:1452 length:1308 start_codon:yes stop_codon:yes gene_type:complete
MSIPSDISTGIDPETGFGLATGITPAISGARADSMDKYVWTYTLTDGSMTSIQEAVAQNVSKKSLGSAHGYAPSMFTVTINTAEHIMTVELYKSEPTACSPTEPDCMGITRLDGKIRELVLAKLNQIKSSYLPGAGEPYIHSRDGFTFDVRIPNASVAGLDTRVLDGISDFLNTEVSTNLEIPIENVSSLGSDVLGHDDNIVMPKIDDVIARVENGPFKVKLHVPMCGTCRASVDVQSSDAAVATATYDAVEQCIQVSPLARGSATITVSTTSSGSGDNSSETFVVTVPGQPVLSLLGDSVVHVDQNESYVEAGATSDGGETVIITGDVDTATPGTYTITYKSTNAMGECVATRTVVVIDTTPPTITIVGDNPCTVVQGEPYVEEGATADGGETVVIAGDTVDEDVVAAYSITYTAENSAGNASTVTRIVNVVEP